MNAAGTFKFKQAQALLPGSSATTVSFTMTMSFHHCQQLANMISSCLGGG
jgi:hypothetical protein